MLMQNIPMLISDVFVCDYMCRIGFLTEFLSCECPILPCLEIQAKDLKSLLSAIILSDKILPGSEETGRCL